MRKPESELCIKKINVTKNIYAAGGCGSGGGNSGNGGSCSGGGSGQPGSNCKN